MKDAVRRLNIEYGFNLSEQEIDLIAPIPQLLSAGFGSLGGVAAKTRASSLKLERLLKVRVMAIRSR